MSTYPISHAVGSSYVDTFKSIGIRTTRKLLDRACEKKGREVVAAAAGIDAHQVLDFVNAADLMRIKGMGIDYVRLLRVAGVPTVRELRHRNADNLFAVMKEANDKNTVVDFIPPKRLVARWIEQAKLLPLKISYK